MFTVISNVYSLRRPATWCIATPRPTRSSASPHSWTSCSSVCPSSRYYTQPRSSHDVPKQNMNQVASYPHSVAIVKPKRVHYMPKESENPLLASATAFCILLKKSVVNVKSSLLIIHKLCSLLTCTDYITVP